MKKLLIVLLAAFVLAVVNPTKSEAKVMYDGAEVVKGQTGKMTFKKDIKIYRKNSDGTFESLVVKRNNFFKNYQIRCLYPILPHLIECFAIIFFNIIRFKKVISLNH